MLLNCVGWWASCSLQSSLFPSELSRLGVLWAWEWVPLPVQAPGCDLHLQVCRLLTVPERGEVTSLRRLMFVPSWWHNPSEANANFESTGVAATCVSLGFLAQSRRPRYLVLLNHSQGPGLLRWFQKQSQMPKVHHLKISSEKHYDKLLFSAFKIRVNLKPMGFATWISRSMRCLFSERNNHRGLMDGEWPLQQITTGWEVRGGCEWLISNTYYKELKNKGIIWEQLQRAGIWDVSLVAVLKSLLQLFFLYPLSFEIPRC